MSLWQGMSSKQCPQNQRIWELPNVLEIQIQIHSNFSVKNSCGLSETINFKLLKPRTKDTFSKVIIDVIANFFYWHDTTLLRRCCYSVDRDLNFCFYSLNFALVKISVKQKRKIRKTFYNETLSKTYSKTRVPSSVSHFSSEIFIRTHWAFFNAMFPWVPKC